MERRHIKQKIIIILTVAVVCILTVLTDLRLGEIVEEYSQSRGKTILVDSANSAVIEILAENNVTYDKIVNLNRDSSNFVTSLETDIVSINKLKSLIGKRINEILEKNNDYNLYIPVGTVIGNKLTIGRGPALKFKMKLSSTVNTDFVSNFYSAGINQVIHQIVVTVKMEGYAVMPHYQSAFTTETSFIAAQTVIVGMTPDAYTSVTEAFPDTVGDIFDYGAEKQ